MRRALPSVTALSAFEAAGRLESFSQAASELNVTQGAISRQIRALEEYLGIKLFVRLTRRVELTDTGRSYLREIQFALDHVEQATKRLRMPESRRSVLTISVLPSVASFWLMPRLIYFTQRHPTIETRLITSIEPVDLHSHDVDIAIRVGPLPGRHYGALDPSIDLEMTSNWRGVHAEAFYPDILVPVLSPDLIDPQRPLQAPRDLLRYPLIHTATRTNAWPDWLQAHGVEERWSGEKLEYGHFFMAIEAARKGKGIAIVPSILMVDAKLPDLIMPFPPDIPSAGEYYLLMLAERLDDPPCAALRAWIHEQAQASRGLGEAGPAPRSAQQLVRAV